MADIRQFFGWRHLRAEPSLFILHHRNGKLVRKGRGLSFWFWELSSSISQIPMDDREVPFLFEERSADQQDVTVQGIITYRVVDPVRLGHRLDFSIDTSSGAYTKQPLESLALLFTQMAQQLAWEYLAKNPLRTILEEGFDAIRRRIDGALREDATLGVMGLELETVRVSAVQPTPEVERALQMPTLEKIQQQADEATFQRRALAVEKERAIQENELDTQLELARRQELLIDQEGQNARREAEERAEADRIAAEANAAVSRIASSADAESIRMVEEARVDAERERMRIYADASSGVLLGLAARELAKKLHSIEHLNITPEMLGPVLDNLMRAGTKKLSGE